jgi:hypothetical protein
VVSYQSGGHAKSAAGDLDDGDVDAVGAGAAHGAGDQAGLLLLLLLGHGAHFIAQGPASPRAVQAARLRAWYDWGTWHGENEGGRFFVGGAIMPIVISSFPGGVL